MKSLKVRRIYGVVLAAAIGVGISEPAFAHCDGLDGPVVKAAQHALELRDPAPVLIWVQPKDEGEVVAAFAQTIAVRALNPQARALADRYFFETVVRIHRAGEGAPYTGLKPAGRDLGPAIPAADAAIDHASADALLKLLSGTMDATLRERFTHVLDTKDFKPGDLAAGREHVKEYVEFIHYIERLYDAMTTSAHGHFDEPR